MISTKYQKIYDEFIKHYKNKHVNPWHEIRESELNSIYNELINNMDVVDKYTFNYFMSYIIKRLSGTTDAHSYCDAIHLLPIRIRIFNDKPYLAFPDELKGAELISINDVGIGGILEELDNSIIYGTDGKKRAELEISLVNEIKLLGIPSLRNSESLTFEFRTLNNKTEKMCFDRDKKYEQPPFNIQWTQTATYEINDSVLIYRHNSSHKQYENKIEEAIAHLEQEDLSNVTKIIIDLRWNTGGSSNMNKPLLNFLEKHQDKTLIVLTNYKIFSAGRYALINLIKLGAITIGEGISTPFNCYGNSNWINVDGYFFSSSESYLAPSVEKSVFAHTKEEFINNVTEEDLIPNIFKPDIYIEETLEDFLNNHDPMMEEALNYQPVNKLK